MQSLEIVNAENLYWCITADLVLAYSTWPSESELRSASSLSDEAAARSSHLTEAVCNGRVWLDWGVNKLALGLLSFPSVYTIFQAHKETWRQNKQLTTQHNCCTCHWRYTVSIKGIYTHTWARAPLASSHTSTNPHMHMSRIWQWVLTKRHPRV